MATGEWCEKVRKRTAKKGQKQTSQKVRRQVKNVQNTVENKRIQAKKYQKTIGVLFADRSFGRLPVATLYYDGAPKGRKNASVRKTHCESFSLRFRGFLSIRLFLRRCPSTVSYEVGTKLLLRKNAPESPSFLGHSFYALNPRERNSGKNASPTRGIGGQDCLCRPKILKCKFSSLNFVKEFRRFLG